MGVHNFLCGISSKVNVIVQLDFEFAYYDVAVQHVTHCITGNPLPHFMTWFGFFVQWHINPHGLFKSKPIHAKG